MNWSPCKHANVTEYHDGGSCDTPYCEWSEYHCRDCGRFVVTCGCGFNACESGWPRKRHRTIERRHARRARERYEAARAAALNALAEQERT